jgi:hypothetical protein
MRKKNLIPQSRRHILVYDEDWEFIEENYGKDSDSKIGTGKAIRSIIHSYVKALKEKANNAIEKDS